MCPVFPFACSQSHGVGLDKYKLWGPSCTLGNREAEIVTHPCSWGERLLVKNSLFQSLNLISLQLSNWLVIYKSKDRLLIQRNIYSTPVLCHVPHFLPHFLAAKTSMQVLCFPQRSEKAVLNSWLTSHLSELVLQIHLDTAPSLDLLASNATGK